MLPIFQICVPPMNPAIADKTVIASWIIFFHTLLFTAMIQQFIKLESRPRHRYIRKQRLGVRKLNLPAEQRRFEQP